MVTKPPTRATQGPGPGQHRPAGCSSQHGGVCQDSVSQLDAWRASGNPRDTLVCLLETINTLRTWDVFWY